jgi:hypothetical protein
LQYLIQPITPHSNNWLLVNSNINIAAKERDCAGSPVTGEFVNMNKKLPSILVINSCGKLKSVTLPNQPTCKDLVENKQREIVKRKFERHSIKAGYLYKGEQAKFIRKSVDILKDFSSVDYKILSAGFGIADEDDPLPPYDCSFTGKTKNEIEQISKRLNIPKDIQDISKIEYDLVYLALGKNYLTAIGDVEIFASKSKLVVQFNPDLTVTTDSILTINQKLIVDRKHDPKIFKVPIGGYIRSKGSLLLNYALDLREENKSPDILDFRKWWEQKEALL